MKRLVPALVALGLLMVDRVVKFSVLNGFDWNFSFVRITLFRNSGLVFSLPSPYALSIVLMLLAFGLMLWTLWRGRRDLWLRWPVALLVAGAVSNLYDRLVHGFVIDYVFLSNWLPIVNLADLMLTAAVLLLVFQPKRVDNG